jgi:hypothetical protein
VGWAGLQCWLGLVAGAGDFILFISQRAGARASILAEGDGRGGWRGSV